MVSDNILVTKLSLREAARGYIISLKASGYSPRYIESVEMTLRLLADYSDVRGWPGIPQLTASHIEEYLVYLQERPRWFGDTEVTSWHLLVGIMREGEGIASALLENLGVPFEKVFASR